MDDMDMVDTLAWEIFCKAAGEVLARNVMAGEPTLASELQEIQQKARMAAEIFVEPKPRSPFTRGVK